MAARTRDPELRLALLESAGELACRPDAAAALAGGGAAALARAALLPPLAWRAGKAAAAVRFAALAALGALLRRRLLSQVQTERAAGLSGLLHVACSCEQQCSDIAVYQSQLSASTDKHAVCWPVGFAP